MKKRTDTWLLTGRHLRRLIFTEGRRIAGVFLVLALSLGIGMPAHAETLKGADDWQVVFNSDREMVSNFRTSDLDEVISGMQPGDNAIFTLALRQENSMTCDWYMTNKVLYSLEDRSRTAGGGAYTYRLVYTDKDGVEQVLFDSDTVGGDTISAAGEGLHEATDSLEDYFYLDTLAQGEGGSIFLEVILDGETQGNDYQNTLADLQMNFAVEPVETGTGAAPGGSSGVVKTGDSTNMLPLFIVALISGLVILILLIFRRKTRKKEQGNDRKSPKGKGPKAGAVLGLVLMLALGASLSGSLTARAAEDEYTYTVRIFSGAQGTLGGSEVITYTGLHYGERVTFNQNIVSVNDGSKYYVKGIRESGKDNNTVPQTPSFTVTGDQDYVVAYGLLGSTAKYTVNYVDESGNALAPSETYYGNVGDKPVIAFLYMDGYQPQAYNLTGTLSADASENEFTFVYQPVSRTDSTQEGQETGTAAGTGTDAQTGTGTGTDTEAGTGEDAETGTETGTDTQAGTGEETDEQQPGADEETEPEELVDLDEGEVPLSDNDLENEETSGHSNVVTGAAIAVTAFLVIAAIWILYRHAKRKKQNE